MCDKTSMNSIDYATLPVGHLQAMVSLGRCKHVPPLLHIQKDGAGSDSSHAEK